MSEKLPKGWNAKKIVELNKYKSRNVDPAKAPSELFELYSVPSFPLDTPELLTGNQIKSTKQRVEPGDVLLCKINPRINRVWVVASKAKHKQIASSEWIVFRNTDIDPHFAKYFFSSPTFREKLCEDVSGVGGSLTRARPKIVSKLPVAYPSLDEQKRIVARLDQLLARVDSCRAHLDRAAAAIKRFRQSVLNAAVTGQLFPETLKPATVEIANRFMDYKLPEIPLTWSWTEFSDVATVVTNLKSPDDYPEYPHIAPNHIESYSGRLLPIKTVKEDKVISPNHLFSADSIIYSKIRPYLCKAVVVDFEGLCSADMYPIKTTLNIKFLHMWILSSYFTKYASQNQSRVVLPKINQTALYKLPVPIPTSEDQKAIVEKAEAMLNYADSIESKLTAARERVDNLTASILAKAFRGELL